MNIFEVTNMKELMAFVDENYRSISLAQFKLLLELAHNYGNVNSLNILQNKMENMFK